MSYVRAKQCFKDAQRSIKASQDVVSLQLTESLEKHIAELHSEIVMVRKNVASTAVRKPRSATRKRR
jgi:hypothetical protein